MTSSRKNARRRSRTSSKTYPLTASPFFRLERRRDLAKLLNLSSAKVIRLLENRDHLYVVRDEIVGGKMRRLTVPLKGMRRCHERLLHLLRRIELPDFIRCPRKKSTAWGNALTHLDSACVTSFDIKAFYPSTTEEHIFRFFRYRLEMSEDCARQLALLCSHRGYLPLGSPMSPHLAALVHLDLFEEAGAKAANCANKLTVWVDDITVSGAAPRRDILISIKRKAAAKGLAIHKTQRGGGRRGVELTGTYIRKNRLAPANSSHLRMKEVSGRLATETDPAFQYQLLNRLTAMARHQRMLVRGSGERTERLDSRIAYYRRRMRELDRVLAVTSPAVPPLVDCSEDGSAPFD